MPAPETLRLGFVPGVTPDKWARTWHQRQPRVRLELVPVAEAEQRAVLDDWSVDLCLVRLPLDTEGLHLIRLYDEVAVVVMSVEHELSLLDEVTADDLDGQIVNDGPAREAIETAAAGTGVVLVPMSVARLHHRKDVTFRPLAGATATTVGLAWSRDRGDERFEELVGVVRGRTANSSRGAQAPPRTPPKKKAPPRPAKKVPGKSGRTPLTRKHRPR
ncbi:MAG: hypothetical protein JWO46_921 [Nocardioidaceae bacterium]|nr:hypothetical protein [Nocardioidaceae bacterium]